MEVRLKTKEIGHRSSRKDVQQPTMQKGTDTKEGVSPANSHDEEQRKEEIYKLSTKNTITK